MTELKEKSLGEQISHASDLVGKELFSLHYTTVQADISDRTVADDGITIHLVESEINVSQFQKSLQQCRTM